GVHVTFILLEDNHKHLITKYLSVYICDGMRQSCQKDLLSMVACEDNQNRLVGDVQNPRVALRTLDDFAGVSLRFCD
ncbi:MAG: hypothetical protein MK080_09335, partial [Opitutales bacterium]|nr:hypothetical protein [Opitutales bacterium]